MDKVGGCLTRINIEFVSPVRSSTSFRSFDSASDMYSFQNPADESPYRSAASKSLGISENNSFDLENTHLRVHGSYYSFRRPCQDPASATILLHSELSRITMS